MKPKLTRTAEANVAAPISHSILLLEYKMHLFALSSLFHFYQQNEIWLLIITSSDTFSASLVENFSSLRSVKWQKEDRDFVCLPASLSPLSLTLTAGVTVSAWHKQLRSEAGLALGASSRLQPSLPLSSAGTRTPGFYSAITGPGPGWWPRGEAPPHRSSRGRKLSGQADYILWPRSLWLCYFAPSPFIPLVPLTCHHLIVLRLPRVHWFHLSCEKQAASVPALFIASHANINDCN